MKIHEVTRWSDLQRLLHEEFCGSQWVFRGQRDHNWPLQTKLERVCRAFERSKYREAESHLLQQFQRRLHHYHQDVPDRDDTLEWFALMQHHGAPTRLLDWTKSPFVAAYFAVEECSEACACAVWVINIQALHNDALEGDGMLEAFLNRSLGSKESFSQFVLNGKSCQVFGVESFRMNERMAIQQGLFLVPVSLEDSFMENLGTRIQMSRIDLRLEAAHRLNCLEELRKMNIHRGSLFPGIDGFAQSLMTEIEIWGSFDTHRILIEGKYNELF